ncbi:MAG TPA: HDOD domain-containing protein [Bryobacteraceae bacterium]|nr:HDOD domain-containing protein [Bryobacteraceae bacterium]
MQRSAATISASLKKVPPFPPVAAKLLEMLASPAVESNDVADLIASDATFTARLLQRANSAEFGFITDVTSARRAVALLGLDLTRQITLAHATAAYVGGAPKTEALRRSWQHTVATAVLAEEIAFACEMFTSVAFTAGIMHDIGRLGLLVAYPDEYERLIRDSAAGCLDLLDFEQETFGVHHAEAGRMLAERWGLPPDMAVIAGRHHDACEGEELDVLRIVHVACRLADVLGYDVVKPLIPRSVAEVLAELPLLGRQRLTQAPEQLLKRIEERIREFTGETGEIQPEEALTLLASAAASYQPAPVNAPAPRVKPEIFNNLVEGTPVEGTAAEGSPAEGGPTREPPPSPIWVEPAPMVTGANWTQAIVVGIVMGLVATAVLAYWLFR